MTQDEKLTFIFLGLAGIGIILMLCGAKEVAYYFFWGAGLAVAWMIATGMWKTVQEARHTYKTDRTKFWTYFWLIISGIQWVFLFFLVQHFMSENVFIWTWTTDEDGEPTNPMGFWSTVAFFCLFYYSRKRYNEEQAALTDRSRRRWEED